jgi:hypothetical protein
VPLIAIFVRAGAAMISHESKVALEEDVPSGNQLSTFLLFRATEMDNAPSVCFHQCRHVFIACYAAIVTAYYATLNLIFG